MSDVIDFTAACEAFAATHNWNEDPPTYVGVNDCPHFGPWAESLLGSDSLSDVNRAYLALSGSLRVRGAGGYFADLDAADLGLDTRSLGINSGHEGLYSLHLGYASCRTSPMVHRPPTSAAGTRCSRCLPATPPKRRRPCPWPAPCSQ
jgi:hypothetical protein